MQTDTATARGQVRANLLLAVTDDSHLDHGLGILHVQWLRETLGSVTGTGAVTLEMPARLAGLRCGLHGPATGESPVSDEEAWHERRGTRPGESRMCPRRSTATRLLTVIWGPDNSGATILYTAFPGPLAPREPWDTSLDDAERTRSVSFWAEHALSNRL